MDPAALFPGLGEHIPQRLPEPQRAVADSQHRGAHPAPRAITQQVRPRLAGFPVAAVQRLSVPCARRRRLRAGPARTPWASRDARLPTRGRQLRRRIHRPLGPDRLRLRHLVPVRRTPRGIPPRRTSWAPVRHDHQRPRLKDVPSTFDVWTGLGHCGRVKTSKVEPATAPPKNLQTNGSEALHDRYRSTWRPAAMPRAAGTRHGARPRRSQKKMV